MADVPIDEQIRHVAGELNRRRLVNPHFIAQGALSETSARRDMRRWEAVLDTLQSVRGPRDGKV